MLSQEEGAGADGEDGAFTLRVFLLEVGEGPDDTERFGFVLEHAINGSTRDNENVKFTQTSVRLFVVDMSSEAGTGL